MQNLSSEGKKDSLLEQLKQFSERGNYINLAGILESNDFSKKSIDESIRTCIRNFPKVENEENLKSLKLLLDHYQDCNYKNELENNTTLTMECARLGNSFIFNLVNQHCKDSNTSNLKEVVNLVDNNSENAMHKLILSLGTEEEKMEIFKKLIEANIDINRMNKDGYSPLALSLVLGNSKMSEELINEGANKHHIIPITGDSMLHCAVLGKNPHCLNLVNDLDRKYKNTNGESPIDLALKMNLTKIVQILQTYGENPDISSKLLSMMHPLQEYKNRNYEEALKLLNDFKMNKNSDGNISLEWNRLLTEYMLTLKSEKENLNNQNVTTSENFIAKFLAFFQNLEKESSKSDNYLLFLNFGLLYFKLGDYKNTIKILYENLQKAQNHYEWIMFVNVSFILTKIFLHLKNLKVVNKILENLEEFLNTTLKNNEKQKDILKDAICDYLNSREIINKFTPLDESFCLLALFKSYKFILEDKLEESKKFLKEYKRIFYNCKYKDQMPIFNSLKNFYHYLKIKIDYHNNSFFKCYKHLNSLVTFSNQDLDSQVFYLNTIGIINLKQKKYKLAEFFLKNCLNFYRQNINKNSIEIKSREITVSNIKYNIGLCHFYEKNYERALKIFKSIKGHLATNPFVFYRIGLCLLELELAGLRIPSKACQSEIAEKFIGFKDTTVLTLNYNNLNSSSLKDSMPSIQNSLQEDNFARNQEKENSSRKTSSNEASNTPAQTIKRIILRNKSLKDTTNFIVNNTKLYEAIESFKKVILLIKDNFYYKKEINDVTQFFSKPEQNLKPNPASHTNPLIFKSNCLIIVSSYLNLLFCLSLKEQWAEVLFYAKEFETSEYFNKEVGYTVDNFKIEALLAFNLTGIVLEILKKNMMNNNFIYNSLDFKGSFYNKLTNTILPELSYKLALYVNIIKMNFINNNLQEVEKGIISVLSLLNINLTILNGVVNHNDLPPFILNLLIYYFLAKENYEVATTIIKRRKLPFYFAQSLLSTSTTRTLIK